MPSLFFSASLFASVRLSFDLRLACVLLYAVFSDCQAKIFDQKFIPNCREGYQKEMINTITFGRGSPPLPLLTSDARR
jgi:hypothetical protein